MNMLNFKAYYKIWVVETTYSGLNGVNKVIPDLELENPDTWFVQTSRAEELNAFCNGDYHSQISYKVVLHPDYR